MSLKNITPDDNGVVSMSWSNAGSFDDVGMGLLDDIWESKMPSSTSKPQKKMRELQDDSPTTQSKRQRVSSGMSSSGKHPIKKHRSVPTVGVQMEVPKQPLLL